MTSTEDGDCICEKIDPKKVTVLKREGNHHFNGDFQGLADAIWEKVKEATLPEPALAEAPAKADAKPATP